jgi:CheY-like chemotaxis protein
MESRHKILLLDDDPDLLEVYKDMLSKLPSQPEVHTANTGARALALLNAESFRLLICDLKMPKMDGLQVLSIVRRRFPELRTVVMTGIQDEEFRSRAYSLGVDMFWLKPETQQNLQMFLECLESLLGKDNESGFRGIQSKSLMDIIQMECLSQSSLALRITHGPQTGKIWINNGELIDAEAEGARGEPAFRRILEWKSGTFENLPAEADRERTIHKSVNAVLLEAAQALDENANGGGGSPEAAEHRKTVWRLSTLTREGAEWVASLPDSGPAEGWGTQATEELGKWMKHAREMCRKLSEKIDSGPLAHIHGQSLERRIVFLPWDSKAFLVAWPPENEPAQLLEQTKKLASSWDS